MRNTNGSTTINKKAIILYYSHRGKTAAYAREITMYLWSKGLSVSLCSISDAKLEKLREYDYLITGCWTCGWFVIGQHPHNAGRISADRYNSQCTPSVRFFSRLIKLEPEVCIYA